MKYRNAKYAYDRSYFALQDRHASHDCGYILSTYSFYVDVCRRADSRWVPVT